MHRGKQSEAVVGPCSGSNYQKDCVHSVSLQATYLGIPEYSYIYNYIRPIPIAGMTVTNSRPLLLTDHPNR